MKTKLWLQILGAGHTQITMKDYIDIWRIGRGNSKFENMTEFIVSNVSNIKKSLSFLEYKSMLLQRHICFLSFFAVYNISFQYQTPCRTFFHYYFFAQTDHFIYLTSFFFKKWLLPTNRKKNHKNPEASQTGKIK